MCTGLSCSSHALDKLQLYIQITKAQVFLSAGETLCLLKLWLAQDTQTFFDFLIIVLNILLHYQLLAGLWCITEVLVVTSICFALFQTWKFAVLEPNAGLSAGTTNCKQQIFSQSQPQTTRELQCKCPLFLFVQVQAAVGHCMWPMAVHRNCSFSAKIVIFKAGRKRSTGSTAKFRVYCSALKWQHCSSVRENGGIG